MDKKLDLILDAGYNSQKLTLVDTSSNRYNWFGEVSRIDDDVLGEMGGSKTFAKTQRKTAVLKESLIYRSFYGDFTFSSTQNMLTTSGEDRLVEDIMGYNPYTIDTKVKKVVSALGYNKSFYEDKFDVMATIKNFYNSVEGAPDQMNGNFDLVKNNKMDWGWNIGAKYQLTKDFAVRLSFEDARRLPDTEEIMGDAISIISNLNLKSERSQNLSFGLLYKKRNPSGTFYRFEANAFYRRVRDLIILIPLNGFFSQYDNWYQAKGFGADMQLDIEPVKWLRMGFNTTALDLRKKGFITLSEEYLDGMRLPNIPYLFSNANIEWKAGSLFNNKRDGLSIYSNYQFVQTFNLFYAGGIDNADKAVIPRQHSLNAGINYSILNRRLSFTFECQNLLDNKLYDNYKLQKPGRNYRVKLNFNIF